MKIKLKAWDDETKKMVRPILVENESGVTVDERGFELIQFTGLLDVYGLEIWEGDWIKDKHGKTALVKWYDDDACFIAVDSWEIIESGVETTEPAYELDESEGWCVLEVIGNIYQNPELLEPPK